MKVELTNNWLILPNNDIISASIKSALTYREPPRNIRTQKKNFTIPASYMYGYITKDNRIYIPVGLYSLLSEFFPIDTEIVDHRRINNRNLVDNVFEIYSNINEYREILPGIELRSEQLIACRKVLFAKRGILNLATGFGKSEVICATCAMLKKANNGVMPTVLIFEPTLKLVNDMGKRFAKYGMDFVLYSKSRKIIPNTVNITHPKSLSSDLMTNADLLSDVEVSFGDECLSKSTKILLPSGEVETIENIYNNDSITEVMSYNFEKECYESKKILRKIRTEFNDRFMKLCYINPVTNKEEFLLATPNHKIWTYTRGYVRVDELTLDDEIKVDVSEKRLRNRLVCQYCGKQFDSVTALGGHIAWCSSGPYRENTLETCASHQEGFVSPLANLDVHKKAMITRSNNPEYRQYLSNRMRENNPSYDESVVERQKKTKQKLFMEHPEKLEERKCNYIKATHKKNHITDLEQKIIDLQIPGLEFTGNGDIIYLANGRRKIPDFTFRNGDEVKYIEISSKYWYSDEYISQIVKDYEEAGLDVLYITDDNLEDLEGRIRKFLFNHRVKISKICKAGGRKSKYKYNLEIADNHNYFANNILVSNCHHMASETFRTPTYDMPSLIYSIGVSASAISQEHVRNKSLSQYSYNEVLVMGATGPLLLNITADYLITKGDLAKPILFRMDHKADEEIEEKSKTDWHVISKVKLNSNHRNHLVAMVAEEFVKRDRKVLILVNTSEWAKRLLEFFSAMGLADKVFATYGGGKFEIVTNDYHPVIEPGYKDSFERFDKGEYSIMIGTTHLYEGADIKNLDVIILAFGGRAERLQIQGLGRALRKSKTGKYAYVVDFTDSDDLVLSNQSKTRLKRYKETIGIPDTNIYDELDIKDIPKILAEREGI